MKHKNHSVIFLALTALAAISAPALAQETNTAAKAETKQLKTPGKEMMHSVHYSFGHRFIPKTAYQLSVNFREALDGTDTEFPAQFAEILTSSWTEMWESEGYEAPPGLSLEVIVVGGGTNSPTAGAKGFLITFPEPPQLPDNHFAFIFVDKTRTLRYLTYEKTFSFEKTPAGEPLKEAVLCGWNPDGSRANYGHKGAATRAAFIKILERFLPKETAPLALWNPSEGGEVQ